jgi:hypothetical protein
VHDEHSAHTQREIQAIQVLEGILHVFQHIDGEQGVVLNRLGDCKTNNKTTSNQTNTLVLPVPLL